FSVQGFSFNGSGQNTAMSFVRLEDWDERRSTELGVEAVAGRAMGAFSQIRDALVFAVAPPPVIELGTSGGFDFFLEDNTGRGHAALIEARNQLLGEAMQSPLLVNVRPAGQEDQPQLRLDIDHREAGALGVSIGDINST